MKEIEQSTGEQNLILAEIDETVGYGVFAGKDFEPGSYICRYGGRLSAEGLTIRPYSQEDGGGPTRLTTRRRQDQEPSLCCGVGHRGHGA